MLAIDARLRGAGFRVRVNVISDRSSANLDLRERITWLSDWAINLETARSDELRLTLHLMTAAPIHLPITSSLNLLVERQSWEEGESGALSAQPVLLNTHYDTIQTVAGERGRFLHSPLVNKAPTASTFL